jgi:hypothetical protein
VAGAGEIDVNRPGRAAEEDMRTWMAGLALAAVWAPGALAQEATQLSLSCIGTDAVVTAMTPYAWSGRTYAGGIGYGEGRAAAQLAVSVDGNKVRVRPPKTSVPLFAKDAKDGWYELTDVTVDKFVIRGRLKWNRLDRATLEVDRRSGQAVFGAFAGNCQAAPATPEATKF